MPSLGTGELMIILLIVVVVFGSTKLPQLGDGLGRAIKNFKRSVGPGNEIDVTPRKDKGELRDTDDASAEKPASKDTAAR